MADEHNDEAEAAAGPEPGVVRVVPEVDPVPDKAAPEIDTEVAKVAPGNDVEMAKVAPENDARVAKVAPEAEPGRPAFVLHEHRRPQHHFDLRLEEDGVLRSWAVPRGMPTSSAQNRLAVQVDDHELAHLTYQDADKSIADIGWWEEVDRNERRLVFTLHGRGAPQRYALIRTSRDWLLHRTKDQPNV